MCGAAGAENMDLTPVDGGGGGGAEVDSDCFFEGDLDDDLWSGVVLLS